MGEWGNTQRESKICSEMGKRRMAPFKMCYDKFGRSKNNQKSMKNPEKYPKAPKNLKNFKENLVKFSAPNSISSTFSNQVG